MQNTLSLKIVEISHLTVLFFVKKVKLTIACRKETASHYNGIMHCCIFMVL